MLKHVGRHGDKKVVVLYREIPGESHMCLVVYSDVLPRMYHDAVMTVIESPVGQQAESFADALFRNMMPDGNNCLEVLHKNGMIKKVNTNQIIMTPTPANSVRLDELNDILNEMKKGEDAIKRLADLDKSLGLAPNKKRRQELKEVGVPPSSRTVPTVNTNTSTLTGVLSDADLALSRIAQAELMKKNASAMIAEAERLVNEAQQLDPTIAVTKNVGPSKTKTKTSKIKAT
jgi:hypothetical protein